MLYLFNVTVTVPTVTLSSDFGSSPDISNKALSDGAQSITPDQFDHIAAKILGVGGVLRH